MGPGNEKLTGQRVHARLNQRVADGAHVIGHGSKMTTVVGGLGAAPLEREELIAQIDEGRGLALPRKSDSNRRLTEPIAKRRIEGRSPETPAAFHTQIGSDIPDLAARIFVPV